MSDFLKSLVARQLGEAPSVRPRLAGRFEPPADAFAPDVTRRATGLEEPETDALELFLEVETHAAPARDAAPRRDIHEDSRPTATPRETDETHPRAVFVKEPREESKHVLRQERGTTQDAERTHDAPPPSNDTDSRSRTRVRDEEDAHVRTRRVVPASDAESEPVKPETQTAARAPFVTRARARVERAEPSPVEPREPSPVEPREPSEREVDEVKRPSNVVRPATPTSPARREVGVTPRPREEELSFPRDESTRSRERERRREDADESQAARQALRGRESASAIEPRPARRRERQAAARDTQVERAEAPPTINVTIGRVEIRATQGPPPAQRRAETAAPRMSLDDYLRRRNGEVRE